MSVLGELLHERRARPSVGRMLNMGAVTLSVGLLLGTVVWGWRVVVRDVTGVPVVRALEGPSRIAPLDPEGETVENQGLSVNQVQAEGTAGEIADRVRLAPDAGALRDSDLSPGAMAAADMQPVEPVAPALSDTDSAVLAVLDESAIAAPVQIISADIPGVTRSPIPGKRPESLVSVASSPVSPPALNPEPPPVPVTELAATDLPVGTRLVQLGSFDSADEARAAWDSLTEQFGDLMAGKTRVILEGNVGATRFWRLRAAGFDSREDATRFCLVIEGGPGRSCITVAPE